MTAILFAATAVLLAGASASAAGIVFEGGRGPGRGKQIVLVTGDEEYRSEEGMPQLAKILATRHGFKCTVLFAIDPKDGTVNPDVNNNIPGLEALDHADLMILFTRWRNLPDDQMKHIVDYVQSGRPIIGLRTATHAFDLKSSNTYALWTWNSREWEGGFGRQVLGETWINHHGKHAVQSTRGIIAPGAAGHPILTGTRDGDIWGPTDVYEVRLPLSDDSKTLVLGEVLTGMQPSDPPVQGKVNDPMMPVAWTRSYNGARVFTTTMGASQDLQSAALRRLLVNATYWALGMERSISPALNVDIVGEYHPTAFGFGKFRRGLKPEDFK